MLLDIILLVVREAFEAAALLSVLLCVSNQNRLSLNWLWVGLFLGSIAAIAYAINFSKVSELFDYAGQEVFNASMQIVIYAGLILICTLLIIKAELVKHRFVVPILTLVIGLAVTQELAEIMMFYTGFLQSQGEFIKAVTSGFIGLMVGASFGVLCYVAINSWRLSTSRLIQIGLLALIAAGMSVQATQLLIQVDWISASKPVWDTNWFLSESSTIGQMAYAILDYEATPTKAEVFFYFTTLVMLSIFALINFTHTRNQGERLGFVKQ